MSQNPAKPKTGPLGCQFLPKLPSYIIYPDNMILYNLSIWFIMCIYIYYLVVSTLWKIWVRQLGWWTSQLTGKNVPNHQYIWVNLSFSTRLSAKPPVFSYGSHGISPWRWFLRMDKHIWAPVCNASRAFTKKNCWDIANWKFRTWNSRFRTWKCKQQSPIKLPN